MKRQITFVLLSSVVLGGCSFGWWDSYNGVTKAIPPRASAPSSSIVAALACIKDSGALRNTKIAIAIHADGTGKYNHIAEGATGNYLDRKSTRLNSSHL